MNKKSAILIFSGVVVLLFGVLLPIIVVNAGNGDGFNKLPSGLQYKIVIDKKQRKAGMGDIIKLNLTSSVASPTTGKDSVLFSSYQMGGEAVEIPIDKPKYNGDAMEGFKLLGAGDSAVFLMPIDSMNKGQALPPLFKHGEFVKLAVSVVKVSTKEEYEKDKQAEAQIQNQKDAKMIDDYLKQKGLTAQKTADGLYYIVEKQGDGARPQDGKKVKVNYTGKLMDGKIFDSSLNPGRQPFEFVLGQGQVIKGWDKGIPLFNVGGKGTLLIPSSMGYGSRGQGPIPPNSVLIFDIEVLGTE